MIYIADQTEVFNEANNIGAFPTGSTNWAVRTSNDAVISAKNHGSRATNADGSLS